MNSGKGISNLINTNKVRGKVENGKEEDQDSEHFASKPRTAVGTMGAILSGCGKCLRGVGRWNRAVAFVTL